MLTTLWTISRVVPVREGVKFKPDAKPSFCKPRAVPIALQEDLSHAYDAGIAKGVWTRHFQLLGACAQRFTLGGNQGRNQSVWWLFSFGKLAVGDSSPSIATAGGVDAEVRRRAPVHQNWSHWRLQSNQAGPRNSKEVGSQYTPRCAVTKRPAVRNFLGTRLLPKHYG